jgi:hypothetical protein
MSAEVKWKHKRDGAAILHSVTYQGFPIIITNWPGTRTLWIEIKNKSGATWITHDLDKAEHRVASAKERALDTIREHLAKKEQ